MGVKTVAELMGNTPQTVVRYYIHSSAGYKKGAADVLPSVNTLLGEPAQDKESE